MGKSILRQMSSKCKVPEALKNNSHNWGKEKRRKEVDEIREAGRPLQLRLRPVDLFCV